MALALAANGAKRIYILGRRLASLEEAAASCPQGTLSPIVCDVTSKASLSAAAATIAQEVGYVNLVIANAGAAGPPTNKIPRKESGGTIKAVQEFLWAHSEEAYARQYEIHATATLWTAVAFLDLLDRGNRSGYGTKVMERKSKSSMLFGSRSPNAVVSGAGTNEQNGVIKEKVDEFTKPPSTRPEESLFTVATSTVTSQIIAISSIQGINKAPHAGFGYGASKAAQIHLSRMLAVQLEPFGIRSNSLAPGFFPSELTAPLIAARFKPATPDSDTVKLPRYMTPMERMGRDEEVAGTVVWLAGRAGAYCNGSLVVLDGGRMLVNPGGA